MPETFYFPNRDVQLWTPLTFRQEDFADRGDSYVEAVGRLERGVTFEQARAELSTIAARLARDYPEANAETVARACACCSSRVPISPTCCWRARRRTSANWRCARRWVPARSDWCGS
jgi:hypothetical protein